MKKINTSVLFALLLSSTLALSQVKNRESRTLETVEEFAVIGISMRTTNENGQSAQDIEKLWGRFWGEGVQERVPNKASEDIYAVYMDYESDYTAPYTVVIGLPVTSLETIPEGFVGITIEAAVYEKFVSKGKMPQAVVNTWMEIWQKDQELNRAYQVDFTVHSKKYYDGDNAEVATFISVNE